MLTKFDFLMIAVINLLFLIVARFLNGYLARKGENIATKEDISKITTLVESVKLEHADKLEKVKIELQLSQERQLKKYHDQYDSIKAVWAAVIRARNVTLSLRPISDVRDSSEREEDRRNKLVSEYIKLYNDFSETLDQHQPFIPTNVYTTLVKIRNDIFTEGTDYRIKDPQEWLNYWDKAEKNQENIRESVD